MNQFSDHRPLGNETFRGVLKTKRYASRETRHFLRVLKLFQDELTTQERQTLKGQALSGDLSGAQKGLTTLVARGREADEKG
ncbi:hypothetical protein Bsel_3023 [[Bacillus] selenitireducens MLS10]|uniref:Uncharacterized protein n=1 Tax=Bacillus selenitireducens (strain ATCC 700615 / DSM 15326 / MLS10) TaxID=439292 RepID=D6Y003_BACIE|nr:hypothetical protein Bsel_3023 [[Bacillus] selenitireducens MLS10]